MRSFEELNKFEGQELEEERKRIEDAILNYGKIDFDLKKGREIRDYLKDYYFLTAKTEKKFNPENVKNVYDDVHDNKNLDDYLTTLTDHINNTKDLLNEAKNKYAKKIAYGRSVFAKDGRADAIKHAKQLEDYLLQYSYEQFLEEKARRKWEKEHPQEAAKQKEEKLAAQKRSNIEYKASLDARDIVKFSRNFERKVNSVDYFLFGKGSTEFNDMKEKVVELRKYAEAISQIGKNIKTEHLAVYYDKLKETMDYVKRYLDHKEDEIRKNPGRVTDPDKQAREQPRIKTSIKLLEDMETLYQKGVLTVTREMYQNAERRIADTLRNEEATRVDKKGDQDAFLESAGTTIRSLGILNSQEWGKPVESLGQFYRKMNKEVDLAVGNKGNISSVDVYEADDMVDLADGNLYAKTPKDKISIAVVEWYRTNKDNIDENHNLKEADILKMMKDAGFSVKNGDTALSEKSHSSLKGIKNDAKAREKLMVNSHVKEAEAKVQNIKGGMGI